MQHKGAGKTHKESDYIDLHDCQGVLTQTFKNCAETHLGGTVELQATKSSHGWALLVLTAIGSTLHHVKCALIGLSHKLATHEQLGSEGQLCKDKLTCTLASDV